RSRLNLSRLTTVHGGIRRASIFARPDGTLAVLALAHDDQVHQFQVDGSRCTNVGVITTDEKVIDVSGYFSPTDERDHIVLANRNGVIFDHIYHDHTLTGRLVFD